MKRLVSMLALISWPLAGSDGVVEINQATVEAAGGFPYAISEPGSYILTGNLSIGGGDVDGIVIETSEGVTLDLNGFTIDGEGSSGDGISQPLEGFLAAYVRLSNGTVRGFNFGVSLPGSQIEGVTAVDNAGDGIRGIRSQLIDCVANENGGSGLAGVMIIGGVARGNGGIGIVVAANGLVADSFSVENDGLDTGLPVTPGVQIFADTGALVLNNTARADSAESTAIHHQAPLAIPGSDPDTGGGSAGNVVIGQIVNGFSIGCNTINGETICPAGGQD